MQLILAQVVKKLPAFMKPEDVFLRTKAVVTGSYPEPLQSNPHFIHLRFCIQCLGLPNILCLSAFPTKIIYEFLISLIRVTSKPMYWI
jgi:hypothetical protein